MWRVANSIAMDARRVPGVAIRRGRTKGARHQGAGRGRERAADREQPRIGKRARSQERRVERHMMRSERLQRGGGAAGCGEMRRDAAP